MEHIITKELDENLARGNYRLSCTCGWKSDHIYEGLNNPYETLERLERIEHMLTVSLPKV